MCGLFGIAGPGVVKQDIDILNELMHVSSLRGLDATGLVSGKPYTPTKLNLFRVNSDFIYWRYMLANDKNEGFVNSLFNITNQFFIGHCRKKTLGEDSPRAAHPFEFDNIVGTHNGTVVWPKETTEGYYSDSHQLFTYLNDAKGNLQEVVDMTAWGDSMALVWFDKKKRTLNFFRNSMRTLYYVVHPTRSVMYWASEEAMLRFVLARNNVKIETLWYLKPGYLYTVKPGSISSDAKKDFWESVSPITMPVRPFNPTEENDFSNIPWLENKPSHTTTLN